MNKKYPFGRSRSARDKDMATEILDRRHSIKGGDIKDDIIARHRMRADLKPSEPESTTITITYDGSRDVQKGTEMFLKQCLDNCEDILQKEGGPKLVILDSLKKPEDC